MRGLLLSRLNDFFVKHNFNMGVSRASCAQMWGIEENSRGWRIWLIFAVFRKYLAQDEEYVFAEN